MREEGSEEGTEAREAESWEEQGEWHGGHLEQGLQGLLGQCTFYEGEWQVVGGEWLVTRVGVGLAGSGSGLAPAMGDASSDGIAINAGTVSVAGSAGEAGRDGVGSDARVRKVDEPVAGYPNRAVPTKTAPVRELRRRTLTNLYNERPQWLMDAHGALDRAVAKAYGWDAGMPDDDALRELLHLNLQTPTRN